MSTSKHVAADDVFGKIGKKCWELQRRILEGTLNPFVTLDNLQLIIEGKKFIIKPKISQTKVDERYTLINTFEFTVPKDYKHEHQLASFSQENKGKFYGYNDNITDVNFVKATQKLVPCKTYSGKIFQINKTVTSEDNLSFLKSQSAILVGAQGLSLVRQLKVKEFPAGKWTLSFDEKEALGRGANGNPGVPNILRFSDGDWSFNLVSFENVWDDDNCLLCVCDLDVDA